MASVVGPASVTALTRYYRNQAGESIAEISQKDKVSEYAVKQSIRDVEVYRSRHKIEHVQEAMAAVVLGRARKVGVALDNALGAKTEITDAKGRIRKVADVDMQLKGVAEIRNIISTIQPKAAHQTNVGVAVGVHGGKERVATGTYSGMEDLLTEIMKEQESNPEPEQRQLKGTTLEVARGEYEEIEPAEVADE
jgi:hypothetical protein